MYTTRGPQDSAHTNLQRLDDEANEAHDVRMVELRHDNGLLQQRPLALLHR